jgi:hypothetical protein
MPCKQDVKQAILNQVMTEAVDGRYTFNRVSPDSVIITNKGKAQTAAQAKAIAKSLADRIDRSFYGHVKGTIIQVSPYDPVTVQFTVSQSYIDHVYNGLPANQRTEGEVVNKERDYVNTNTGPNTYEQLGLFSVDTIAVGSFNKYIAFKKGQLTDYRARLNRVQADKKKSGLSVEELNRLNKLERDLKLQIDGSDELNIKGLKQEIGELMKNADINAVGYYVEKDMIRLAKLTDSKDLADLKEAENIIQFYRLAGTFERGIENPFFSEGEIFLQDENGKLSSEIGLPQEVIKQYFEWRKRAEGFINIVNARHQEILVETVNSDPSIKRTYPDKKFTFNELINSENGLKDTDWISMWTMDITSGIFSHNGVLPQIMFSFLANTIEKKAKWARDVQEKTDELTPKVQRELIKMGYTLRGGGIVGLKGASYQLFKEITKEGNETGGLVQRFIKEFFDVQAKVLNTFSQKFDEARLYQDYAERNSAVNKAFEDIKRWRRQNTIIMDITRLPEFSEVNDNTHKDELIKVLGQKGYEEQIARQKNLLNKYESERQSMIDVALESEGASTYEQLSNDTKKNLAYWESNNSPFKGIEDYNSAVGIFDNGRKINNFMTYNNFIPRRNKVNISVDNNKFKFVDTNDATGFYSEAFAKIEGNSVLSEFYDLIKEVSEKIREEMPYDVQQSMAVNTIPALQKSSAEMLFDKDLKGISFLFESLRHLYEKVRLSFGVTKQSEVSYATIDPVTGKANYKVNDQFLRGNSKAVRQRMTIEKTKFIQATNRDRVPEAYLKSISRFTSFQLDSLNEEQLILLAQYLHLEVPVNDIRARRLDAIRAVTGNVVEIGKYIRDYSLHTIVQSQSFDLAKIAKYFSDMTMLYSARREALPVLEVIKRHYEGVHKPKTNNLGSSLYHSPSNSTLMNGLRVNGNKQMDDWFERVALGNYETKHFGPHGLNDKLDKVGDRLADKLPKYKSTIYSDEEKRNIKEINALMKNEKDPKKLEELSRMKENMGKARTATALFDNLLGWIRTLRLGYNLSSATTNLMEGVTSNMILASLNQYFDPKEIYYGYGVMKHSMLKNASFGLVETKAAKKNRSLMDRFNVVMDSRNELQKSSMKTHADKLSFLHPHALNTRIEYINQSPIMIAMLRTEKIKDKDGNESSVWDAFTPEGHLKEEFKTEDNMKNWEEMSGESYLNFKQKLHKAIVTAHGNYDELRGMMIKNNTAGKALMMFKGWLPMQFYQRFAVEQDDIQAGIKGFKGRYWSYTAGSGFIHGATVGAALFGPVGLLVGFGGAALGKFFGVKTEMNFLKEMIETGKFLFKKSLGMPVNMLTGTVMGKSFIDAGAKDFDKWVGTNFSAQDAKNMRGNMADISMQLAWIALILLVKNMFWDDDDEKDSKQRIAHNIVINKLMQLSSQAAMYVNPVEIKNTITNIAVAQYFADLGKEVTRIQDYLNGDDIAASGPYAGKSNLAIQTKKILMPGLFKDTFFGFETQATDVFEESPYHRYFRSEETIDKKHNQASRAARKLELEEELSPEMFDGETEEDQKKAMEKEIKDKIDEELPTPSKLEKLGLTREEYEEQREEE